jgi:hypothetical protein
MLKDTQKITNRIIVLILVLILMISNLYGVMEAQAADDDFTPIPWDGVSTTAPIFGDGSHDEPYIIMNPSDLAWVAEQTNTVEDWSDGIFIELGSNIELDNYEWTPIGDYNSGDSTTAFKGTFNGAGFDVLEVSIQNENNLNSAYAGLFGYVIDADISDLEVRRTDIELFDVTTELYVGALAGYIENTALDNISTNGDIKIENVNGDLMLGGIAGEIYDSNVADIKNNVELVVGTKEVIEDEVITTAEVAHTGGTIYVGGLVGILDTGLIDNSYNWANIQTVSDDYAYVGGLVGSAPDSELQYVYNEADIDVKAGNPLVGGLIASFAINASATKKNFYLAYNTGNITVEGTDEIDTLINVGGIAAYVGSNNEINHVYNASNITIIDAEAGGIDATYSGALVAFIEDGGLIKYSYFDNEVEDDIEMHGTGHGVGNDLLDDKAVDVAGLPSSLMRQTSTYSFGYFWNFSSIWMRAAINGYYPILREVGYNIIHIQTVGEGTTSNEGVNAFRDGNTVTCYIEASPGYQIQSLIVDTETIFDFKGATTLTYTISEDVDNFAIIFEVLPFYKTRLFLIAMGILLIIIIMIVGTIIINNNYDKKMNKMMAEQKNKTKIAKPKINNPEL